MIELAKIYEHHKTIADNDILAQRHTDGEYVDSYSMSCNAFIARGMWYKYRHLLRINYFDKSHIHLGLWVDRSLAAKNVGHVCLNVTELKQSAIPHTHSRTMILQISSSHSAFFFISAEPQRLLKLRKLSSSEHDGTTPRRTTAAEGSTSATNASRCMIYTISVLFRNSRSCL